MCWEEKSTTRAMDEVKKAVEAFPIDQLLQISREDGCGRAPSTISLATRGGERYALRYTPISEYAEGLITEEHLKPLRVSQTQKATKGSFDILSSLL
jgi:hypothetical protein